MSKGKKVANTLDNGFDFDNELVFDDIDFQADPFKDDRKPATKVKDGLKSGIKAKVSDPSFITGVLRELLPKGYGDTLDMGDKVATNLRQLYSEAAAEVRPAIKDFKRVASKLAPKDSKFIPGRLKDIFKRWEDEAKDEQKLGSALSARDQRDSAISIQLAEVFKEQIVQSENNKIENEGQDLIKEGIELNRHRDIFSLLNQSAMSLSRISQYQTTINLQYQKKSLELQHRQLFAQYDILETVNKTHVLHVDAYNKLIKNTGLPDWQKINLKELSSQKLFGKFSDTVGTAFRGLLPSADEYLQMTTRKIRDRTIETIKRNAQGFRSGLTDAEMAREQVAPGMLDTYQTGGEIAGDLLANTVGYSVAKRFKEPIKKVFPKVEQVGDYLENFNENIVGSAENFRKDDSWSNKEGIGAWIMRGLQSILPSLNVDSSFNRLTGKDLSAVQPFTLKTERSINEIIPGYLSRILQEIQIIRTGNPNIDRVEYDQDKGRFTGKTKLLKSIASRVYNDNDAKRTNDILDKIIDKIDSQSEDKLSEEERISIKQAFLKNKMQSSKLEKGLEGRPKELTSKYLSDLESKPSEMLLLNRQMNSLVRGMNDPRATIEQLISEGRQNELVQLGIITRKEEGYDLDMEDFYKGQIGKKRRMPNVRKQKTGISKPTVAPDKVSSRVGSFSSADYSSVGTSSFTRSDYSPLSKKDQDCEVYFKQIIQRLDTSIGYYKEITDLFKASKFEEKDKVNKENSNGPAGDILNKGKTQFTKAKLFFKKQKQKISEANVGKRVSGQYGKFKNYLGKVSTKLNDSKERNNQDGYSGKSYSEIKDKIQKLSFTLKDKWVDLRVSGEENPRIIKAKLQAGHYVDLASGKIVKTLSDINGTVKDIVSGQTVLKSDELDQSYVKDKDGQYKRFGDYAKGTFDGIAKNIKNTKAGSVAVDILKRAWTGVKDTVDMFKSVAFGGAKDVWVGGEKYPRMTAVKMQQGHYSDAISGKTIYLPEQIQGEVKDEKGRSVVSVEELDSLVVYDSRQKRFAPIRKLLKLAGKVIGGVSWYYNKIGIPLTKFNFRMLAKGAKFGINLAKLTMGTGPYSVKDVYAGDEPEPRLYATRLRNGEYFNRSTGRPIYHQNDINGEVVDAAGNVKIFDEDLPNLRVYNSMLGIFNPFKPAKWIMNKLTSAAAWTMKKGLKLTKLITRGLAGATAKVAGGFIRYLSKPQDVYVKGEPEPRLRAALMKAGRYISEKTGKIISLVSDIDGPVWDQKEETMVLSNEDIDEGLLGQNGKPLKTSTSAKIISGFKKLNKLFSRRVKLNVSEAIKPNSSIKNKKDKEATTGEQTVSLLGDIKNTFTDFFAEKKVKGDRDGDGDREGSWEDIKARRDAERAKQQSSKTAEPGKEKDKKGGLIGLLSGALDAITGFLGGFKTLLKGGGVLSGLGKLLGIGRVAGLAGSAVTAVAGAGGVGAAATGALGALGAGLAAVVSSPVTLGILGAAAVGYGAYKGYKAVRRWMSKPTVLDNIRYVQYGFKKEETSYFSKIVDLEEYLKQFVKVGSEKAELEEKKIDIEEMMSIFGFSSKDNDHKRQFGTWYIKRFKPVYLTHVSALSILNGSIDLSKINDLKKDVKLKYIEATKFPSGPYKTGTLPILGGKYVASDSADVSAAIEAALKEFATPAGDAKKTATGLPTDVKPPQEAANTAVRVDLGKPDEKAKPSGTAVTGASTVGSTILKNTVSAFDAIRYKTYGIKELELSKVIALNKLENETSKLIKIQGTKATFDDNFNELLQKVNVYFGISDLFGPAAVSWGKWFRDRFLPVYLNYVTAHITETGKPPKAEAPVIISPNKIVQVAKTISSINGVWSVTDSPWPGYQVNTDSSSVEGNLEYLAERAKEKTQHDYVAKTKPADSTPLKSDTASTSKEVAVDKSRASNNAPALNNNAQNNTLGTSIVSKDKDPKYDDGASQVMKSRKDSGLMTADIKREPVKTFDPATNTLLEFIGQKESNGNYNILVGGKTEPNLTKMSIAEVSDYQKDMIARGHESTAVGKYQIIRKTLSGLIKAGYAKATDIFNPVTQDKLAVGLLKMRGLDNYVKGKIDAGQFADNISKEWASLPYKTGRSYYAGVGSNKSSGAREDFVRVVSAVSSSPKINGDYVMPAAAQQPPRLPPEQLASSQIEGPKSSYNPKVRPIAQQEKAVQASKQASSSPLNDAVGVNPRVAGTSTENNNAAKNTLTADIMVNTESLLAQSLIVHKETLDIMKLIYDKINTVSAAKETANVPTSKSDGRKYEPPSAPVSMRKSA
jgi:muramidase (phage lysozyme)